MKKLTNRQQWIQAIKQTEQAFWTIVFSGAKQAGDRGVLLPKRFDSKVKIRRFLQRSMSPCLASRVIGNLDLRRIRGHLAVPVGDGIGAPPLVKSQVLSQRGRYATVAAWFQFDPSDRFFRVYQLKRSANGRWIVYGRHPLDYPFNVPGVYKRMVPSASCCTMCIGSS